MAKIIKMIPGILVGLMFTFLCLAGLTAILLGFGVHKEQNAWQVFTYLLILTASTLAINLAIFKRRG